MERCCAGCEAVKIATRGVYVLPKNPSAVIAQGARGAWDGIEERIDLPGTGLYPVGIATEAQAMASLRSAYGWMAWRRHRRRKNVYDDVFVQE